ncbi:MAG: TIM barrel protein, partial [Gemmatimonadales bacterium]|nr:TIM barrel protein [Gemmatimonadales bacterium]NIP05965.1 TIM barrel protein [Gemmatimonadales bacterium]NIQ98586.1 TIM barrel protein [Gemmatimonadales bacterium]
MRIELGCFTRPWGRFSMEQSLAGIAAAGFRTCGFGLAEIRTTPLGNEPGGGDVARINALVSANGLQAQALFGNADVSVPMDESVAKLKATVDRALELGMSYIVLMGTEDESRYDHWYGATERCLDYARQQRMMLVLKPHGGLSALAADLLRAASRLDHPNFGICYDPGNIYYYTGEKAEDDLPAVATHVKAVCIKDVVGGKHGEVMITPGSGLVDFPRIFTILKDAGFSGPCWVECLGGGSLDEINAEARRAYSYI